MIDRIRTCVFTALSLALTASCNRAQVVAPLADSAAGYFPAAAWRTADPARAGFVTSRIEGLRNDVTSGRYGTIDGLVVVRYGYVVHEQYADGWNATRTHTMQSVSKSITALLYGIATSGDAAALDRKIVEVFTGYAPIANADANKNALTVRDLLTMRTSMNYWEQPYPGSPHDSLNQSKDDWTRFILNRPMTGTPGTSWSYNSGAAILTCSVIRELTHEKVTAFAQRELFQPTGVTSHGWFVSPFDSLPHCGGGLNLSTPDLARIGYLVLRHGKWGHKQVVPEAWVQAMVQPYSSGSSLYFATYGAGYGYFWWLFPETRNGSGYGVFAGSGSGGQWIFVVPSKDVVIALTATNGYGLDLLYGVLAALK